VSRSLSLGRTARRTMASFLNLFWRNDKGRWDRSYAEGHWGFLDSIEQGPRHRVIADLLRAREDAASSVLDVGCGTGALVPHLPDNVSRYVGIDLSSEAIRICRGRKDGHGDRTFMATSFDDYAPVESFEVIVFNEMLYYYPMRRIPEVIARARGLLTPGTGSIIVSIHERSLKKRAVWRRLRACMVPTESTTAVDPGTGNAWRIERYDVPGTTGGAADVEHVLQSSAESMRFLRSGDPADPGDTSPSKE